jgi:hypothetical protein
MEDFEELWFNDLQLNHTHDTDWDVDFESNDVDILFTWMVIRPSRGQLDPSAL